MTTTQADSNPTRCDAEAASCAISSTATVAKELGGGLTIRRALPSAGRRLVGPWCFLDHFGPVRDDGDAVRIGPHPHIGLQTVTWLYQGQLLHRDSLGNTQSIRPGQLNIMTSGHGISHSEESAQGADLELHGLQFWLALPSGHMDIAPAFEHHPSLPAHRERGFAITAMVGSGFGLTSPAGVHSPLVGLDLQSEAGGEELVPLDPHFEHALYLAEGELAVDGQRLGRDQLHYLGLGRERIELRADGPVRAVLIGGEPRPAPLLMWWNFVADDREDIVQARKDWGLLHPRFGEVSGYDGPRLPAPPLDP